MNEKEFEAYALCPLDGRYSSISKELSKCFSEYTLTKYRVKVEIEWLIYFVSHFGSSIDVLKGFTLFTELEQKIRLIEKDFRFESYTRIKEIEKETNHDVKAVEFFIGEKLESFGLQKLISFVHIGCTSEDINNCAYAFMYQGLIKEAWINYAKSLLEMLKENVSKYSDISILSHTHGQPATPTTVGKEFANYYYRFCEVVKELEELPIKSKFNGAIGNYNAIMVAFPDKDWEKISRDFVENVLGFTFNPYTTQIENHDYLVRFFDCIRHFNNILIDFDVDFWFYISMGYFKQLVVKGEVGSSTMPHKVNPIRFENSESNSDTSNSLLMGLSNKLPKSRMQRDLSDSSSLRNIGMAIGYSVQAITQTVQGLQKIEINLGKMQEDLDQNWEVLAEPIQTILRKNGDAKAYDTLKELTRGKKFTRGDIIYFVSTLTIPESDKNILLSLTPKNYIGYAKRLSENI